MNLIIISGRSGSGKSSALHLLEDEGYYSIDNLPVTLLPQLISALRDGARDAPKRVAVCIDARNASRDLSQFNDLLQQLPDDVHTEVVYLDADDHTLIKRFSETRRRHPLSDPDTALAEALAREKAWLEPIAMAAGLVLDTSAMNVHDLRSTVRERLVGERASLSLLFQSFGFKRGIPVDADFVFDLRALPNPHWDPALRSFTGRDQPVRDFLDAEPDVQAMMADIRQFMERWLPRFVANNRSYVTVALGCTGGQHRSVYMVEALARHFRKDYGNVQVRHREQPSATTA